MRGCSQYQITKIFIDDCGMTDLQLSQILDGHRLQGKWLNTFAYTSGLLGDQSCSQLVALLPQLQEIQLVNINGPGQKLIYQSILEQCLNNAPQLRKIKLSNINLNDLVIVEKLCKIIEQKDLVSTLDLSWARLSA